MAAQVVAALGEDDAEAAVAPEQRDEHGRVDAAVDVERRRLLGVEEDGREGLRELSSRA